MDVNVISENEKIIGEKIRYINYNDANYFIYSLKELDEEGYEKLYINKRLVKFKILQKESCVSLRFFLLIILIIVIINNCRRDFGSRCTGTCRGYCRGNADFGIIIRCKGNDKAVILLNAVYDNL